MKASEFFSQVFQLEGIALLEEGEGENTRYVSKGTTLAVTGKFVHPWSGEFELNDDVLAAMKRNHDKKILGTDISIDERHDHGRAMGWVKPGSLKRTKQTFNNKEYTTLTGDIEWTPDGRTLLENKTYKYFSPEFGTYTEADGKTKHENVLLGGALTNRPFLKMMPSIKFDEGQATNVVVLDEGGEEQWELEELKEPAPFNSKIRSKDNVTLEELIAKAKSLGLDVKDEAGFVTVLEQFSTVSKENDATKAKLKEAGINFDDKTPVADVVSATLTNFGNQMQTLTAALQSLTTKSLEDDAKSSVKELVDGHKILPAQFSEYVKLYQKDKSLFESLTKTMPVLQVVQYGEIGGPGVVTEPGQDSEDMREYQDPAKAEERAIKYLEEKAHLTPKSKQTPKKFNSSDWQHGRPLSGVNRG